MDIQKLLSYTRRAVDDYGLIGENDKIAVGISGGKDSLTLLHALKGIQRFYPKHFTLVALTVHLGYEDFHTEQIHSFCEELEVPYECVNTQISDILQDQKHPCSLCARLRKGAFNQAALKNKCNKIAYAHHRDDFIETMFLSLFYEGRFHSFSPKTKLERTGLTLIRPLMYAPEAEIIGFAHKYQLPVTKNPCPADGYTKRQYVKDLLKRINQKEHGVKDRLFSAIQSAAFEDWPQFQVSNKQTE